MLLSSASAARAEPVSDYCLSWHLAKQGVPLENLRADRILREALAGDADPLHLAKAFNLSVQTGIDYSEITHDLLDRPVDQVAVKPPVTGSRSRRSPRSATCVNFSVWVLSRGSQWTITRSPTGQSCWSTGPAATPVITDRALTVKGAGLSAESEAASRENSPRHHAVVSRTHAGLLSKPGVLKRPECRRVVDTQFPSAGSS